MTATRLRPFTDVVDAIKRLAVERPDRVADSQYFHGDGIPCCIVGTALVEAGVETPVPDEDGIWPLWLDSAADELPWSRLGIAEPTEQQAKWICAVQRNQDGEDKNDRREELRRWGLAVDVASEVYPL